MRVLALLALVVALTGCDLPRDPEGTLGHVEGGTLRAGLTAHDPWVRLEGERPRGVEVGLVEAFAADLHAEVTWVEGSEAELFDALQFHELDLVVAGLSADTPWQEHAAVTRPYVNTREVVGIAPGTTPPPTFEGVEIAVEEGDSLAAWVRRLDAVPVRVPQLEESQEVVAAPEWLLDDLGKTSSGTVLRETEHVMAVPLGENAWQVRLERFLLGNQGLVQELLDREGRP
jgi:polar amino acid transport system substrate-binding protein